MSTGARSGALSATWCGGALLARPADPACPDSPVAQIMWPSRLDLAVATGRNSRGKVWFDTENRKWNKPPCCQMTSACTLSVLFQKDTHRREGALGTSHAPPSLCRVCQDNDACCRFWGDRSGPGPLSKASRARQGLPRAQGFPLALLMGPGPPLAVPSCASRAHTQPPPAAPHGPLEGGDGHPSARASPVWE